MKQTTRQLADYVQGELKGSGDIVLESVASLNSAHSTDLSYAEDKFHEDALRSAAGCIIVRSGNFPDRAVIVSGNPKLAFAKAAERLLTLREDGESRSGPATPAISP